MYANDEEWFTFIGGDVVKAYYFRFLLELVCQQFKSDGFGAVSYTHLDVYKRQEWDSVKITLKGILVSRQEGHSKFEPVNTIPVSYTHLDVYKRQVYTGKIETLMKIAKSRFESRGNKVEVVHAEVVDGVAGSHL